MKNPVKLWLVILFIGSLQVSAQSIVLDSCISSAERNYPLWRQNELLKSNLDLTLANINTSFWPQLAIGGQYTYQSDVTGLPVSMPGLNIPTIDKNQYKVFLDINQTVYDGGMTQANKSLAQANSELDISKLKSDMYKVKEKVSQLFFGILLLKENEKQLRVSKSDLSANLEKLENLLINGATLESNINTFKAEIIKLDQKLLELGHDINSYVKLLSMLTGLELNVESEFVVPNTLTSSEIRRPELLVFQSQQSVFMAQEFTLKSRIRPKVNLFLQTGFGKPALNMLSNETQGYYLGGIRFSMPLSGLYTYKNDKGLLDAYKRSVEIQKETFLLNNSMEIERENEELLKYRDLLTKDDELIRLRVSIRESALIQLENGVISATDYLREQNAEESARLSKSLHLLQYEMHRYNINLIKGN